MSILHDPGAEDQGDEGNASMIIPLTDGQTLTVTRQKIHVGGNGEAFIEIRADSGELLRAVTVFVSPREPFVLTGGERLNVDPMVERAICRLIFDPASYPDVLAWATDAGTPVPPLPPLPYTTDLIVKMIDYGYKAGEKAGYERGLRDGIVGKLNESSSVQAATQPHTAIPSRPGRFDFGRKAGH